MASNFIWYELMTTDLKAAGAFYTTVVGWSPESWNGDFPYTIMKVGDTSVAGLMNIPEEARAMGQPPAWVGYIHADNVDEATESVRKAGGAVFREPADIPSIGRFSVVADPQGAAFMLMTPQGGEAGPELTGFTPGRIGWRELYTNNWASAFDFYASQFGWEKDDALDMGPMGTYQLFSINGEQAGGMMNRPQEMPVTAWLYYFNVDGIDAAAKRVTDNKGQLLIGPMEVPGGSWIVQCMDPQGAMFALVAQGR